MGKIKIIILLIVAILAIPAIAMQFTTEVNWTLLDFMVAAILLLTTALAIDFVIRKLPAKKSRIIAIAAILLALIYVWLELAVGVFT